MVEADDSMENGSFGDVIMQITPISISSTQ
jgi:hypothetical protein